MQQEGYGTAFLADGDGDKITQYIVDFVQHTSKAEGQMNVLMQRMDKMEFPSQ